MFDWLTTQVSGSDVTYLVVLGAAGGDVLIPLIPSETIVISASVIAAHGGLSIWLLIAAAACGAILGDNIAYLLGAKLGDPAADRLFGGEQARRRLASAERAVARHGAALVLVGRFIPGGRTASTFAAGTLELGWRRFIVADVIASLVWAVYATMLGYLGGSVFGDSLWKPLLVALAIAAMIGLSAEGWRRWQRRRGRDLLGDRIDAEHP